MTDVDEKEFCVECNETLELWTSSESRLPCPKCGSTKRKRVVDWHEKVVIKDSFTGEHTGERIVRNYPLIVVAIILTIVSSVDSYFVIGESSIIVGIVVWRLRK